MITNHTQLINFLAKKYNLSKYLEIGISIPANNFTKIKCVYKVGVDPEVRHPDVFCMTSDDFFEHNDQTFDLIFIDGLHHAEQVERDFNNALACLNEGGRIIIHDTLPEDESTTHVPRDSKVWHGDVWKWAINIGERPGVSFVTLNADNGCMVVCKDHSNKNGKWRNEGYVTFDFYKKNRNYLMNIKQPSEIETYL